MLNLALQVHQTQLGGVNVNYFITAIAVGSDTDMQTVDVNAKLRL